MYDIFLKAKYKLYLQQKHLKLFSSKNARNNKGNIYNFDYRLNRFYFFSIIMIYFFIFIIINNFNKFYNYLARIKKLN